MGSRRVSPWVLMCRKRIHNAWVFVFFSFSISYTHTHTYIYAYIQFRRVSPNVVPLTPEELWGFSHFDYAFPPVFISVYTHTRNTTAVYLSIYMRFYIYTPCVVLCSRFLIIFFFSSRHLFPRVYINYMLFPVFVHVLLYVRMCVHA